MTTAKELQIDTSASALEMADEIFGSGVEVISATYTGDSTSSGIFLGGDNTAPGVTPSDTGVILSTGKAESITNSSGGTNVKANTSTNTSGANGDDQLDDLAGVKTYDASILEMEFIPEGDVLSMQIVFSSEEYLEYVNSGFNDVVGVWVNGEEATLTLGDGEISINNINDESNSNLYLDNPAGSNDFNTEMDGLTVTLTLKAPVNPDEVNEIRIGIADGGDAYYDSNLLIAGDSLQTVAIAEDDETTVQIGEEVILDVLANDGGSDGAVLTVTQINGQDVQPGDTVTLATGEIITLNADGTLSIQADMDEGLETFSYTVADDDGNTDIGFVEVNTVPCFTAGTMITTNRGLVPVEDLEVGDRVLTRDSGLQILRWVGSSARRAFGPDAPIEFAENALGRHEKIRLSPSHRVLVKAKHLVNGSTIRRVEDGSEVTYVHLLFDRHEIIMGNGMHSESYHPGDETLDSFDAETRAEILRLMPNHDGLTGFGYGPAARTSLKAHEAELLFRLDHGDYPMAA